jgi:hypothetical protein
MAEPFLSQLLLNEYKPNISRAGQWEAHNFDVLARIAKATPAQATDLLDLTRSVPNMWGYGILFHDVWTDKNRAGHEPIVELWRRTLALVVARDAWARQGVRVRFGKWFELRTDQSNFVAAAAQQLPHQLFPRSAARQMIAGLFIDDELLGLVVPSLLVLPARALLQRLHMGEDHDKHPLDRLIGLRELQQGRTSPPRYDQLWSPPVLGELRSFLMHSLDKLRSTQPQTELEMDLALRLAEFAATLTACEEPHRPWPRPSFTDDDRLLDAAAGTWPALRLLLRTTRPEGTVPTEDPFSSDCQIETSEQTGQRFIYFSDAMHDSQEWLHTRVFKARYVGDLQASAITEAIRAELRRDNIFVVQPDDLLQPKLIRVRDAEFGTHGAVGPWRNFLLPFTPFALACFGADELLGRLRMREESENSVTIEFDIPLGPRGASRTFTEKRDYRRGGASRYELVDASRMTTLALWPDIPAEELPLNLVFQGGARTDKSSTSDGQLIVRRPLTSSILRSLIEERGNRQGAANNLSDRVELERRPEFFRSQMFTTSPIIALECGAGSNVGLFLTHRRRPVPPIIEQKACCVAIDFGTTNTTMVMRYGDDEADNKIDTHVWLPLDAATLAAVSPERSSLAVGVRDAAFEFIPPTNLLPSPFLSLVEVRGIPETAVPLARARIPFVRGLSLGEALERIRRASELGIHHEFGLKWEADGEKRRYIEEFLFELMLLAVANARWNGIRPETIEWRFTIPRSLPPEIQRRFDENVRRARDKVMRGIGAPGRDGTSLGRIGWRFESRCIYHYLRHEQPEAFGDAVVTLDIGGQSTDIALYDGKILLWDGSAQLAGQTILIDFLIRHSEELALLLDGIGDIPLRGADLQDLTVVQKKAMIELLVNDTRMIEQLAAQSDERGFPGVIRDRARIALLGIMYFVCRFLLEPIARRARGQRARRPLLAIVFGGRGSMIFQRLCLDRGQAGRFGDHELIEDWFERSGFQADKVALAFSRHPKQEVALGALVSPEENAATTTVELIPAESPWEPASPAALNDADSATKQPRRGGAPTKARVPPGAEHAGLGEFCRLICNRFPQFSGLVHAAEHRSVEGRLRAWNTSHTFASSDAAKDNTHRARSEFFIGLKAILEIDEVLLGAKRD